jgi:hypothetical protein
VFNGTSGAVLSDSGKKLSDFVTIASTSVYSIGVVGSGATYECDGTDDQVQFALAVGEVPAGATIKVLAGTYSFSASLTVNKLLAFEGVDASSAITTAANIDLISVTQAGCSFSHMAFTALAGQSQPKRLIDIVTGVSEVTISNCEFSGNLDITLNGYNNSINIFENTFVLPANPIGTTVGIYLSGSADGISSVIFERNTGTYIHTLICGDVYSSISGGIIAENYAVCAAVGMYFGGGIMSSVIRHNFLRTGSTGIKIQDQDHAYSFSSNNTITGNNLIGQNGNVPIGMDFYGVQNSSVDDNKFNGFTQDFIRFSSTNYPVPSTGNVIIDTTVSGAMPSGGITEIDSSQDYNKYANNNANIVTLAGAHSVNLDTVTSGTAGTSGTSGTAGTSGVTGVDQPNPQSGTSYGIAVSDAGKTLWMSNSSANSVIIPNDSTQNLDVNSVVDVVYTSTGATTVTAESGVTVNGVNPVNTGGVLAGPYKRARLVKLAANTWAALDNIGTVT